jgi:hypothetical protein
MNGLALPPLSLPIRAMASTKPVKKVRFSPDTKDNEAKSSTSAEITHADVIEVSLFLLLTSHSSLSIHSYRILLYIQLRFSSPFPSSRPSPSLLPPNSLHFCSVLLL